MYLKCSSPIKGPRCFLEPDTLSVLLSTGWFQERIRAWFHNQTKINLGPYGKWTKMSNKLPSLNIIKTKLYPIQLVCKYVRVLLMRWSYWSKHDTSISRWSWYWSGTYERFHLYLFNAFLGHKNERHFETEIA